MNADDVETRVRATLLAVAETTDRVVAPRLEAIGELDRPQHEPRRRVRPLALAAATVVALCLAASIAALATRGDQVAVNASSAFNVPRSEWRTTTAPLLAPTWLPPQLHLYQMESVPDSPGRSDLTLQLFGATDSKGRITAGLELGTLRAENIGIEGTSVRVRGHDARIDHGAGGASSVSWVDSPEFEVSATFKGLTLDRAIAIIDGLQPRSERPSDGFDPASLPKGLRVLRESLSGPRNNQSTDLRYAPALTSDDLGLTGFIVRTTTAGDTADYLQALVSEQPAVDGSVEVDSFSPIANGDSGTTRQPIVRMLWPDGRAIEVDGGFGVNDLATLRRIARSARLLDARQTEGLRAEIDAQIRLLPVWASATVDGFVLELRGKTEPLAACLRIGDQGPICAELQGGSGPAVGEVVVGSQWLVFAAHMEASKFDVTGQSADAHQVEVRGWHLALLALGAHATEVGVSGGASVTRPTG